MDAIVISEIRYQCSVYQSSLCCRTLLWGMHTTVFLGAAVYRSV
jgi:hypothetical protein